MDTTIHRSTGLFNDTLCKAADQLFESEGNKGYKADSDFTNNFDFGPYRVTARAPPYSMCVSFQYELILTAINLYAEHSVDAKAYEYLKKSEWFGLNGLTLQNCVWENAHCHSVGQALSIFGMGESLAFAQLTPGSFISYDHGSGGHSVCFLGFLNDQASVTAYSAEVAGFRFIASNGSKQSGDGISYRDGVLLGRKMQPGRYKQSTGIRNMRGGVMYMPSDWRAAAKKHFGFLLTQAFHDIPSNPPTGQR